MNLLILQACSSKTHFQNRLRNLTFHFAEPAFKIGSLNLFNTEPTFRYHKCLKF